MSNQQVIVAFVSLLAIFAACTIIAVLVHIVRQSSVSGRYKVQTWDEKRSQWVTVNDYNHRMLAEVQADFYQGVGTYPIVRVLDSLENVLVVRD